MNDSGGNGQHDRQWQALLAEQVSQNSRLCFRVAYGILRNSAAAEDACQQALLKAWEQRDQIRDACVLRAWLLRVVVNQSLQMLRRSKTEKRVLGQWTAGERGDPPAERQVALHESVLLALEQLPSATREVVLLRLMDGRSGNEVKDLLGVSASEVSRRLHEGMDQLRGLLSSWNDGGK